MMPVLMPTTCQICVADCGLLAALDAGKVVKIKGDPENPQNRGGICVKGRFSPRTLYSQDRILKPLIRNPGDDKRPFREASWDEAFNKIAEKLFQIKDNYGPQALCIYQGRTTRFIDRTFISAFARLFGTPNVTGVWSMCVGPKVLGYQATFGPPLFPWCDFRNAKLIILWGTNPAVSRMHRYFRVFDDIMRARKKGAKLVVIDPRSHRTARAADLHLPIRPGTDSYLALALIKVLIEKGWIDEAFVKAFTVGFESMSEAIQDIDIGQAAFRTGIKVHEIMELARDLKTIRPASIDRREGTMHVANGTQLNRALAILMAITGNVDLPGGLTFNPQIRWNNTLGIKGYVKAKPFWTERFPLAKDGTGILANSILTEKPYPIKALISISGNPVSVFPHTERTVKALQKLELLVVNDLFLTETAQLADIVLPGVTFFEKGEFETGPFKRGQWIKLTEPIVEPLGASRPEWRFFAGLAEFMGFNELSQYTDEDEIMERIFSDSGHEELNPKSLRRGKLLAPLTHGNMLKCGFKTPTGKIELYSQWLEDKGCSPLPVAEDACRTTPEYPYRLITGARIDPFYNSQHRNIPELFKLCPYPQAEISRELANHIEIGEGDWLIIKTRWGRLKLRVKIVEGMNPETVSIPHGWSHDLNVNYLVGDDLYDPIVGTPAYKAIPCHIQTINSR